MPLEVAFEAIDFLFLSAARKKARHVSLGFHGGGEPSLELKNIKKLTKYARELSKSRKIRLKLNIATNGVMSENAATWVARNLDGINVSFDGPPNIQNYQRPGRNGKDAYRQVVKTLRVFESHKKPYYLRGTVTRFSQHRMTEIVTHFVEWFQPKIIQLEPVFRSGRALKSNVLPPSTQCFVNGYLESEKIAKKNGVRLKFSGLRYPVISDRFCGIGVQNFAVTPEGHVTSCFEVLEHEDHRSNLFFFGKYRPDGFYIDQDANAKIRTISETTFPHCMDCFAKFHCAGDCRAKGLFLNDAENYRGAGRCEIIRNLIQAKLKEELRSKHTEDVDGHRKGFKKLPAKTHPEEREGDARDLPDC
jgi:uncharacterized protein